MQSFCSVVAALFLSTLVAILPLPGILVPSQEGAGGQEGARGRVCASPDPRAAPARPSV